MSESTHANANADAWIARMRGCTMELGLPASFVAETGSTNEDAKIAAAAGVPHGAVFVAGRQHAGRGRQGRRWEDEAGASLLFSVVLRIPTVPSFLGAVPVVAGLALAEALGALSSKLDSRVKWPNDVRVNGRKIGGILAESIAPSASVSTIIVGVGVNVGKMQFTPELAGRATSLENEGVSASGLSILEDFLWRFGALVSRVAMHGLSEVRARLALRHELYGCRIQRSDGVLAIADHIDDEGRLMVRLDSTTERWSSGEVHLVSGGRAP